VAEELSPALRSAIEQLYHAFAAPEPAFIPACGCCNSGTDWAPGGFQGGTVRLPPLGAGRPLRELSDDDVRGYAWDVFLTAGSLADFKYYLPRLLELMALGEQGWDGAALTQRFEDWAALSMWPAAEREAMRAFLGAWWDHTIATQTDGRRVEEVLCAIAGIEADLDAYLLRWLEPSAAASLRAFVDYEGPKLEVGGLMDAFWRPDGLRQVVDFVTDILNQL
jgi:hypothetical protein